MLGPKYHGSGIDAVALIRARYCSLLWSGSVLGMPLSRSKARRLRYHI